jgi:NifU-like protein involved in Fe-S cluster formation
MEKKEIELIKEEINQIEKMLQDQSYQLSNCSQMKVFADLPNFPHRIECVNLILRGIRKILS